MSELSRNVTIGGEPGTGELSRNVTNGGEPGTGEGKKRRGKEPQYLVEITTKLPMEQVQQLDRMAEQLGLSRYELMRRTLREALWLSSAPSKAKGAHPGGGV